ncbi:MAG: RNase adapter RapZ [Lachnospiraceae bacterium]|nr:RNase adapter RapZ [Lachnospiraceae bacterium]
MQIVIVTGMSGAGKTAALKFLEDFGFYCVDNLPIPLITKFVELAVNSQSSLQNVALGIDIRNHEMLPRLKTVIENLKQDHVSVRVLYLDASDECLLKRYKETRRSHPLAANSRVEYGIEKEREILGFLLEKADYVINTSQLLTRELREMLEDIFLKGENYENLIVTVVSFGFKYGIPMDADLVFDVRFLPNPFYFEEMRPLTGNDAMVRDYVMQWPQAKEFEQKLTDMIRFLIPNYISEGKTQLIIGIGCTGGKHRSVTIANALYHQLENDDGYGLRIEHRDIDKHK